MYINTNTFKKMQIRPYKDIETAVTQWRKSYHLTTGEVKIKCHNNFNKDNGEIINATILCKIFMTFAKNFNDLKRKYNIRHIGHTFWDYTTWQMKYKDSTCTFEIHSSSFIREPYYVQILFEDQDCSETLMTRYTEYLSAYIDQALSELKGYAPIEKYNSLVYQIEGIAALQ